MGIRSGASAHSLFMRSRAKLIILLILGFMVFLATRADRPYLLQVVNVRTGQVMLEVPLEAGERFTLQYRHSVQLTPVRETFVVEDGQMVLRETEYGALGVGLPYGAEGRFELREDGRFNLFGLNRRFVKVCVWVSEIAHHRLEVRGKEFDLPLLIGDGILVEIRLSDGVPRPE